MLRTCQGLHLTGLASGLAPRIFLRQLRFLHRIIRFITPYQIYKPHHIDPVTYNSNTEVIYLDRSSPPDVIRKAYTKS